jgi:hypothetical protein
MSVHPELEMPQVNLFKNIAFVFKKRYFSKSYSVLSHGSGVAHAGVVAHASVVRAIRHSYGRPQNSTPCRSETVEPIDTNFVGLITSPKPRNVPVLVAVSCKAASRPSVKNKV